jgi:hypothetical protein
MRTLALRLRCRLPKLRRRRPPYGGAGPNPHPTTLGAAATVFPAAPAPC